MSNSLQEALMRFSEKASLHDLIGIADFTKVTSATVLSWIEQGIHPKGETLIRLQHFMVNRGYPLESLKQVPAPAYKLGQLIAFDVLSVDELVARLGYSNATALYRVVQGSGLVADRAAVLEGLVDRYKDEVQAQIVAFARTPEPETKQLVPLQQSFLSIDVLSDGVQSAVALLDNVLDLVDMEPGGLEGVVARIGRRKLTRLAERLMPFV